MATLSTIDEMFDHARAALYRARAELSDARDWLNSDWRPPDATLTDAQAEARSEVFRIIGEAKALIDQARAAIDRSS